jgi:hypothetical protein
VENQADKVLRSALTHPVDKKKKKGAHLLLQIRTKVLNKELRSTFERWYTKMPPTQEELPLAA